MDVHSTWQSVIPDSLLVEIFSHLDIRALGKTAQVCKLWKRVALDDMLWRNLASTRWGITGKLKPGSYSWKDEVKCLLFHVPQIESEVYQEHQDEVLDVAISHNGQYFCTTSKDARAILWKLDYPCSVISDVDFGSFLSWELTQYSCFNESDTLVFVCGVSLPSVTVIQTGRGAVFTVPDMQLVCVIELDPPTLFGAWLADRIFIGGSLADTQDRIKIESYKITDEDLMATEERQSGKSFAYLSSLYKTATPLFTFNGHRYHQMNLLVATIPKQGAENLSESKEMDDLEVLEDLKSESLFVNHEYSYSCASNQQESGGSKRDCCIDSVRGMLTRPREGDWRETRRKSKIDDIESVKSTDSKKSRLEHPDIDLGGREIVCDEIDSKDSTCDRIDDNYNCDKCLTCDIQRDAQTEHSHGNNFDNSCDTNIFLTHATETASVNGRFQLKCTHNTYIMFVTGDHDAIAVHQVTEERLSKQDDPTAAVDPNSVDKVDHYFHIKDCYITGLSLSSDQRFLFFNYREYDPKKSINFMPNVPLCDKIFSQSLRVGTIDLITMTWLRDHEYTGHTGFSDYPAWYICLDASPSFIGSGSEDGKAYLWDRHHQVLLTTLQHEEGVVNGLAFCPIDQETCITVCDDKLIKIWRSRNRLKMGKI